MRRTHIGFIILALGLLAPALTWSQPPGMFRKGMMKMQSPDDIFNNLSGGKDVIVVSELSPMVQRMAKGMMEQAGLEVHEDKITRQRFNELFELGKSKIKAKNAALAVNSDAAAPEGKDGGRRGARGGDRADAFFRKLDANNDGLLSGDEIPEDWQKYREKFDTNHDGSINIDEFKTFASTMFPGRGAGGPGGDPSARPGSEPAESPANEASPSSDNNKPVVYRAGRLPAGLPEWFVRLDRDGDCDGQVGLWEARYDRTVLDNFAKFDLNGDGLITAEEVLRYYSRHKKKADPNAPAVANNSPAQVHPAVDAPNPAAVPSSGGPAQPSSVVVQASASAPAPPAAPPEASPPAFDPTAGGQGRYGPPAGDWQNRRRGGGPGGGRGGNWGQGKGG